MKNKTLVAQRFRKAGGTYTKEARIQHAIAHKMIRLVRHHIPTNLTKRVVEFGCGTGIYSRLIVDTLQPDKLMLNDICSDMEQWCQDLLTSSKAVSFCAGDAERLCFPNETHLITSCSALQWFEAPEEFFRHCKSSLSTKGHLAFTTFGQQNMYEIRQLTGNGLCYRSLTELKTSLSTHYDIIYAEEEILPLDFNNAMDVLYHLKQTGVTGTTSHTWTRQSLTRFCQEYHEQFTHHNKVRLTYHPIYIIATKKELI